MDRTFQYIRVVLITICSSFLISGCDAFFNYQAASKAERQAFLEKKAPEVAGKLRSNKEFSQFFEVITVDSNADKDLIEIAIRSKPALGKYDKASIWTSQDRESFKTDFFTSACQAAGHRSLLEKGIGIGVNFSDSSNAFIIEVELRKEACI
jgi:hypothetical protein